MCGTTRQGAYPENADRQLDGGSELQRCLYAFAVKALLGDDVSIQASLLYSSAQISQSSGAVVEHCLTDARTVATDLAGFLRIARSSLSAGVALPGPDTGSSYDAFAFALPANATATYCKRNLAAATKQFGEATKVWEAK